MKSLQQQLQESYLGMKGILSESEITEELDLEEALELYELSKKTLGSYIKKATDDVANTAYNAGRPEVFRKKERINPLTKISKRIKGITKATDRLTKEEFDEDLDEEQNLDEGNLMKAWDAQKKRLEKYKEKGITKADIQKQIDHHKAEYDRYRGLAATAKPGQYKKELDKHILKQHSLNHDMLLMKENESVGNIIDSILEEPQLSLDEALELYELSKKTLGNYIKKSAKDMSQNKFQHGYGVGKTISRDDPDYGDKVKHKAAKRLSGITKATNRLTKEQVEILESIAEELDL